MQILSNPRLIASFRGCVFRYLVRLVIVLHCVTAYIKKAEATGNPVFLWHSGALSVMPRQHGGCVANFIVIYSVQPHLGTAGKIRGPSFENQECVQNIYSFCVIVFDVILSEVLDLST